MEIQKEVVERFVKGDMMAFQQIYDQTSPAIYAHICRLTRQESVAEDLAHDVYVKIYDARHTYDLSKAFMPWLYRVSYHHTLNWLRRRSWLGVRLAEIFWNRHPVGAHVDEYGEGDALVDEVMASLSADHRMCLDLFVVQEFSLQEVSEILDIPIGTVKSRLKRARDAFRVRYGQLSEQKEVLKDV